MKLTGYYTTAGEEIAAGLLAGETLTITRITAGSGSTALSAAVLAQEQQDLGPCQPEVSGTTAVLRCTLTSDQAGAPYFLRELGVYALDDSQEEVLYLIFRLDEEVSINPAFRLVLRFNLEQTLSDGAGVEVTAPLTGLATQEELKAKADLVGGQVPYVQTPHFTRVTNIYVNSTTGLDTNPGTKENPFRTIQAALDAQPKDLGTGALSIRLAAGSYDEDVVISGFYGGRTNIAMQITSDSGNAEEVLVKSLKILHTASAMSISSITVSGANENGYGIEINDSAAELSKVTLAYGEGAVAGVCAGSLHSAQVTMIYVTVDGYPTAGIVVTGGSLVNIIGCSVKNCGVGVQAGGVSSTYSGIVLLNSVTYEGNTTDTMAKYNGQIFGGA